MIRMDFYSQSNTNKVVNKVNKIEDCWSKLEEALLVK